MVKRFALIVGLMIGITSLASFAMGASNRKEDVARIQRSAEIFHEIMSTPDRSIPRQLLASASCIAIIPGEKQFAFMFGGKYGKGLVTCRTARGWSPPAFLAIGGGSYGFQIGGSSTDIVMVFRSRRGLDSLLSDKFRIGAGATAAAGPVGRDVSAETDIALKAEILTYARSRGVFAGISLDGAVVRPDQHGNESLYGHNARTKQIVDGDVPAPAVTRSLTAEISRYVGHKSQATKKNG